MGQGFDPSLKRLSVTIFPAPKIADRDRRFHRVLLKQMAQ
jgi:hypothetical protein